MAWEDQSLHGLNILTALKVGALRLSYHLPRGGTEGKGEWWHLKAVSKHSKWSPTLYYRTDQERGRRTLMRWWRGGACELVADDLKGLGGNITATLLRISKTA